MINLHANLRDQFRGDRNSRVHDFVLEKRSKTLFLAGKEKMKRRTRPGGMLRNRKNTLFLIVVIMTISTQQALESRDQLTFCPKIEAFW